MLPDLIEAPMPPFPEAPNPCPDTPPLKDDPKEFELQGTSHLNR
jgi:hypothetical protein